MSGGWIKLHRQLTDNPMWLSEPFTRAQAWVDLLMLANRKPGMVRVRGIAVEVPTGSVGWSKEALSKRWKWSRGKTIRFFKELEKAGQTVQQKGRLLGVISICNYSEYQGIETTDDTTGGTTNGTTDGQQTVHEQEREEGGDVEKTDAATPRARGALTEPLAWVRHFMAAHGFAHHEVQTAKTVPMFRRWVERGVTVEQVDEAYAIVAARPSGPPRSPVYLDGVVADLIANAAVPGRPANSWANPAGSSPPRNGGRLAPKDFAARMVEEAAASAGHRGDVIEHDADPGPLALAGGER